MAGVTYLIRALPMTIIRKEIKNPFIKSFLHYVPFVTISSMIFPDVLFCTSTVVSAIVGVIIALYLSYHEKDLITITLLACLSVYITEWIMTLE